MGKEARSTYRLRDAKTFAHSPPFLQQNATARGVDAVSTGAATQMRSDGTFGAMSMPTPGDVLSARYRLGRILGTGAFGRVFYAWDTVRDHAVALKVLKARSANALLQFKREFRAISDVRHPNLVRVHTLGRDGDTWYIVMEMLHGVPFVPYLILAHAEDSVERSHALGHGGHTAVITHTEVQHRLQVRGNPEALSPQIPVLSVRKIKHYFSQLAQGVAALHDLQMVHCDLKPSNIILTPKGRVVVLDFGVMRHSMHVAAQNQDEGLFAGTRYYVAPEVTPTSTPNAAFDWYAVGVILWQFLTGYHAEHLAGLAADANDAFLEACAQMFPTYASLYRLCGQLLATDPAHRADQREVFAVCRTQHVGVDTPVLAPTKRMAIAGRAEVLARLERAWDAFNAGRPQTMVVEGNPGIGKSAVCETFLHRIQRGSAFTRVLLAQCKSHESVGFRAFDEIVDGLAAIIRSMPADEREDVLHLCTPALCQLFPVLRGIDPRLEETEDTPSAGTDPRFALRELLCHVAARYAMVIWLEDIESADEDSLQWIGQIFTPALRPNAFLLITKNRRGRLSDEAFDIETLGYAIGRIPLHPLDKSTSRSLVKSWLQPPSARDHALVDRIVEIGAGRPQLLHALCHPSGDMTFLEGHVTGRSLLAHRLDTLSKAQHDILAVAAISSRPVSLEVVAFMTGQSMPTLYTNIDALCATYLLRNAYSGSDFDVEISQVEVRDAVLARRSSDEIRGLHQQMVRAVDHLPMVQMRPLTLLSHLLQAGAYARAKSEGVAFAQRAEQSGAYATAAEIYHRVIDMERGRGIVPEVSLRKQAVECNIQSGRLFRAAQLLAELAQESVDPVQARAFHERAEENYLLCGHLEEAKAQRQQRSGRRAGIVWPKVPKLIHILWLKERLIRRIEALDVQNLRTPLNAQGFDAKMRVFRMAGLDMGLVDPVVGLEFALRELNVALDSQTPVRIARALAGVAPILASTGTREQKHALDWTHLAERLGEMADDRVSVQWAKICRANIAYQNGEYPAAWKALTEGREWLQKHASTQSMMIAYANSHMIYCAWAMGHIRALRAAYYGQLGDVRARRNQVFEAGITIGGFNTWLIDDVPEAGRASLAQLHIPDTGGPFRLLDFFKMYYGGEIALYTEDWDEMDAVISQLLRFEATGLARVIEQVRNAARFLLARLLMARAMHLGQQHRRWLFVQLQLIGRQLRNATEILGQGWGHQVLGASYLLRGDLGKAAPYYTRAIEHFEGAGIGIFAEPTRAAAHAMGVGSSPEDPYARLRQMGVVNPQKYTRVCHPYVRG